MYGSLPSNQGKPESHWSLEPPLLKGNAPHPPNSLRHPLSQQRRWTWTRTQSYPTYPKNHSYDNQLENAELRSSTLACPPHQREHRYSHGDQLESTEIRSNILACPLHQRKHPHSHGDQFESAEPRSDTAPDMHNSYPTSLSPIRRH